MIYLLEDETNIRKLVVYTLANSGLEAEGFGSVADFWDGMRKKTPNLVCSTSCCRMGTDCRC
ncbi:hypothetical protein SDC9_145780 [bioreactor metagenome]|uniref:Response regulatory domain-containing protein n=1 Tax=bioreactor metagenome TaxID=1076179 RepID=A0A645ED57_9ZZZZ